MRLIEYCTAVLRLPTTWDAYVHEEYIGDAFLSQPQRGADRRGLEGSHPGTELACVRDHTVKRELYLVRGRPINLRVLTVRDLVV